MASRSKVKSLIQQAIVTFSKKRGHGLDEGFAEELDKLKKLVHTLTKEDFNITPAVADRQWDYIPYVTNSPTACVEVYECAKFSIGIFLLKPRMAIPLHDHPGMHGVMKVLFGSISVTAYSKPMQNGFDHSASASPPFLAQIVSTMELSPQSEPCCLKPNSGNIHEIKAANEPVAFVDVLGPPYNPKLGRDCTYYYKETPIDPDEAMDKDLVFLKPGSNPEWFTCVPLKYTGPEVSHLELNS